MMDCFQRFTLITFMDYCFHCKAADSLVVPLQNLESEQLDDQLLEPAPVPSRPTQAQPARAQAAHAQPQANSPLPNVPQSRPAQAARPAKTKEEEELEALEREMAV